MLSLMSDVNPLSVLKSLTEQIVYLNDTGLVFNNALMDHVCMPYRDNL